MTKGGCDGTVKVSHEERFLESAVLVMREWWFGVGRTVLMDR
jgi:hypothetical protein